MCCQKGVHHGLKDLVTPWVPRPGQHREYILSAFVCERKVLLLCEYYAQRGRQSVPYWSRDAQGQAGRYQTPTGDRGDPGTRKGQEPPGTGPLPAAWGPPNPRNFGLR